MSTESSSWRRTRSGARRVLQRGDQLTVQVCIGVEAAALIARMSPGSIGETAARFFDEKNPGRVIPDVAALGQEGIDLTANQLDEREGAYGRARRTRWETRPGRVVEGCKSSISQRRSGADFEALRGGLVARPGRLEGTAASRRPPAAPQRRRGDDRDLGAPGNLQRNVHAPVRVTPTEERRAVHRVDDPDPIGLAELTEFLAEERIFRPRRGQRLAQQSLDGLVGFCDGGAVGLQRYRNARLEVSQREIRGKVSGVERELQVISAVHDRRRYRPGCRWRARFNASSASR